MYKRPVERRCFRSGSWWSGGGELKGPRNRDPLNFFHLLLRTAMGLLFYPGKVGAVPSPCGPCSKTKNNNDEWKEVQI